MSAPQLDKEELDQTVKEVNEDLAAGQGAKHFQDVLDDLESTQGSAHVAEPHDVTEQLQRFMLKFGAGLVDQLRGNEHGFKFRDMTPDGAGTGFMVSFRDRDNRPYNVGLSFEDGFEAAARSGKAEMGREMMGVVIDRLFAARAKWFARMGN